MPDGMRQHVVVALQHLELYANKVKDLGGSTESPFSAPVTFTDDNLLLGSNPHNRPLFVTSYIRE